MSRRKQMRDDPNWVTRWNRPGTGRWWKRQLAKCHRRLAKAECRGMRQARRSLSYYRSNVNWKLW